MALGVGPGDEVVTPGFTYIATAETVALLVRSRCTWILTHAPTTSIPTLLEAAITHRTKAIIPVSLYGQCADFYAINAIAARHGIPVIEDAAQSFGASYKGRKSCNLSTIAGARQPSFRPSLWAVMGMVALSSLVTLSSPKSFVRLHGMDRSDVTTMYGLG